MKIFFLFICTLCISFSHAQIQELQISKLFADTSTIDFNKPEIGQFVRMYPALYVGEDSSGKFSKIENEFYDTLMMIIDALPNCILEIGSHAANYDQPKKALQVTKQKAINLTKYLVNDCSADRKRLRAKGYGVTQTIIPCTPVSPCTEQQKQVNRRMELKIVGFINQ